MKLNIMLTKIKTLDEKTILLKAMVPIIWFTLLIKSTSYLSIYFYIVIFYYYFFLTKKNIIISNKDHKITMLFAIIFSLLVAVSNYDIYNDSYYLITKIIGLFLIFISGVYLFYFVLTSILYVTKQIKNIENSKKETCKVFSFSFFALLFVFVSFFFLIAFPGYISEDGMAQISQIETGIYSNHHPIWHTFVIKIFYKLGFLIFENRIYAIATYLIFQIIIYSLIVAFANSTLSKLRINKFFIIAFCLYFLLMPFNIIYSFTLFKDILFSLCFLLFLTCYIRINHKIGNNLVNIVLLFAATTCMYLFRTNGKFVLLLLLCYMICRFKKEKLIFYTLVASLIIGTSLNYYSTNILKIPNADTVESLSIPIQQVSRVLCDENDLSNSEISLIEKVANIDSVCEKYNPGLSDPIKKLIREEGNEQYLKDNIFKFATLYIRIGFRHPIKYIDAWVDQTKGYFSGGYDGSIYYMMIVDNDYGIYSSRLSNPVYKLFRCYNALFSKNTLQIFTSIGVQTWLALIILYIGLVFKNDKIVFVALPSLFLIITLLIATPVCAEFRYAYPLFMTNILAIIYTIFLISKQND